MKITAKDLETLRLAARRAERDGLVVNAANLCALRDKLAPDVCTRIVNPTQHHRFWEGSRCIHGVFLDVDCRDCRNSILRSMEGE